MVTIAENDSCRPRASAAPCSAAATAASLTPGRAAASAARYISAVTVSASSISATSPSDFTERWATTARISAGDAPWATAAGSTPRRAPSCSTRSAR